MAYSISQNFIKDIDLIKRILQKTDISKDDLVLDIGSGKGSLLIPLCSISEKVIAYEIDKRFISGLEKIKKDNDLNVEIISDDFLNIDLVGLGPYKVFSNIPFSITSSIIKKLLLQPPFPLSCYLFLEKNTSYRYLGINGESIISLSIGINFYTKIIHQFSKNDFEPIPDADIVLVEFIKKQDIDNCKEFIEFVTNIFNKKKNNLKNSLLTVFTYNQVKRISKDLKLDLKSKQSDIKLNDWVRIFNVYTSLKN